MKRLETGMLPDGDNLEMRLFECQHLMMLEYSEKVEIYHKPIVRTSMASMFIPMGVVERLQHACRLFYVNNLRRISVGKWVPKAWN